jgi:hypothetical protein
VGAGVCPISVKLTAAASCESPSADGRNSVAHGGRSCEIIPGRAKAFHAKAQSRRRRKENKAVVLCESLRLGVFA